MNLSDDKRSLEGETSGAGAGLGTGAQAGPAHPGYTVGAVGFGPSLDDDEDGWVRLTDKGWKSMTDSMAASIVRLECELEELRAGAALAEAERIEMAKMLRSEREMHAQCQNERDAARKLAESAMFEADRLRGRLARLERERDQARAQYQTTHLLADALAKTQVELKAERDQARAEVESLRDAACREKCRDKAAADGGWASI